jgi:hypothetical protein
MIISYHFYMKKTFPKWWLVWLVYGVGFTMVYHGLPHSANGAPDSKPRLNFGFLGGVLPTWQ